MGIIIATIPGGQGVGFAMAKGALAGWVSTGFNFKGAVIGAFSAAIFHNIGGAFDAKGGLWLKNGIAHIGSHGLAGGILSLLQGGKFGHGFISAGVAKALNVNRLIGTVAKDAGFRIAVAAVIGGTISKVSGGKFANGAITAAFAQAFNGNKQAERDQAWKDFRVKCGAIVDAGKIDIHKNIAEASNMSFNQFIDAVKARGKWDYKNALKYSSLVKQFGRSLMDEFGNVHFGMVAAASSHTLAVSLYGGGQYQAWKQKGGNYFEAVVSTIGSYGSLNNSAAKSLTNAGWTWGDNLGDSLSIMRGHDYTSKVFGCFGSSCD